MTASVSRRSSTRSSSDGGENEATGTTAGVSLPGAADDEKAGVESPKPEGCETGAAAEGPEPPAALALRERLRPELDATSSEMKSETHALPSRRGKGYRRPNVRLRIAAAGTSARGPR